MTPEEFWKFIPDSKGYNISYSKDTEMLDMINTDDIICNSDGYIIDFVIPVNKVCMDGTDTVTITSSINLVVHKK